MLIFDELKKNDPQLRFVALALACGFFILFVGLWWVQIANAGQYRSDLETQSYRTVRVPAMRGKILDCDGRVLAENAARYNLSLYLGDLTKQFQAEYDRLKPAQAASDKRPFWKFWARSAAVKTASLSKEQKSALAWQARDEVADSIFAHVSQTLGRPLTFDPRKFQRAYGSSRYEPYPILENLSPAEVARFEETYSQYNGVDLDVQSTRIYPYGKTASLVLGYVQQDDSSIEGEDSFFNYRLPDFRGVVGIEGGFDSQLHGRAGEESVLVNNEGFRQMENIGMEPEPGRNVVLTIDLDIQRAAEEALAQHQGDDSRAAVVVMNVHSGDIVALVSSPAIDPNYFNGNLPADEMQKESAMLEDPKLQPQINRATYASYIPGSIFKPVIALAALENGLNPNEIYHVQPDPREPWHGYIALGPHDWVRDTVPPGDYDLKRAIRQSSNAYFIYNGLRAGIENVVRLGEKFHFGEREGLPTFQDAHGIFPTLEKVEKPDWHLGDSAQICFGQGEVNVTPLQIAVAYAAIANGGTVLWPRLVKSVESQDPASDEAPTIFPSGVVRDHIGISQRSLKILRDAMMTETEDPAGTGYPAFHLQGDPLKWRVCGKTGTAQREDEHHRKIGWNYWFASFAPYEDPKYTVIVMVQLESGGSGGSVCAPIAHDIYAAILKKAGDSAPAVAVRNGFKKRF